MENLLVIIVILALFFDFTNGFHDTANAIATSVSTKALKPRTAVLMAAVLNFLGAFISLHVAATIAKGIVVAEFVTLEVVFAGITGAILWNLFTWRVGMPTSSSHALIGGTAGAAIAGVGTGAVQWSGILEKVILPSLAAPLFGVCLAALLMTIIVKTIAGHIKNSDKVFRRLQVVSAGFVAFTHGTNDAQKTMGIIALALITVHPTNHFEVPLWVVVSAASAMALGTYMGGWRIIHTLGKRLVELRPREGFAAEVSTASILWTTASFGFPVSTTHTISSSIVGAGAVENRKTINYKVVKQIIIAWVFTLPSAALVGMTVRGVTMIPGGDYIVFALISVIAWTVLLTKHWSKETLKQFMVRLLPLKAVPIARKISKKR